jgi:DMSO reductase anchor subunit
MFLTPRFHLLSVGLFCVSVTYRRNARFKYFSLVCLIISIPTLAGRLQGVRGG